MLRDLYVVPDIRLAYDWAYGSFGVALFRRGSASGNCSGLYQWNERRAPA